jgi:hypothetical protein
LLESYGEGYASEQRSVYVASILLLTYIMCIQAAAVAGVAASLYNPLDDT